MQEGRLFIQGISVCFCAPFGAASAQHYGPVVLVPISLFTVTHFCVTQACVMKDSLNSVCGVVCK